MSNKEPILREIIFLLILAVVVIAGLCKLGVIPYPCWFANNFDCRSLDGLNRTQLDNAFRAHYLTGIIFSIGGGNKTVCRNDEAGCHCCVDAPPRFQNGDCL
jgi:hypothetical protein